MMNVKWTLELSQIPDEGEILEILEKVYEGYTEGNTPFSWKTSNELKEF